jgi:hypothetical protein
MPQSRGHLTPGERVQGGQVVEPRRGRHFRLGHDYSLVLMRGLATPGARMTYADADGTRPHDISWLTSITPRRSGSLPGAETERIGQGGRVPGSRPGFGGNLRGRRRYASEQAVPSQIRSGGHYYSARDSRDHQPQRHGRWSWAFVSWPPHTGTGAPGKSWFAPGVLPIYVYSACDGEERGQIYGRYRHSEGTVFDG